MPSARGRVARPPRGAAAYCAAKGGLGLPTKVMAVELAEHGKIAAAIAFLASEEARYVTGESFVIDGGLVLMGPVANQDS